MELVEQELNWVLDSPMFFSDSAAEVARSEAPAGVTYSLPGPVTHPHEILYLDNQASRALLSRKGQRGLCIKELGSALPALASGRLGIRFELYVNTILRCEFGEGHVLSRVAVREPTVGRGIRTWGEFDFLFMNERRQRIEHWETSIKFYLQVREEPAWKWYWGPGIVDRLDLKGPKTFLQQLHLSSTDLGHSVIPAEWRSRPLTKSVFAKGTIFYRWNPARESFAERLGRIVTPHALAADHQKSWWIECEGVNELRSHFPQSRIIVLPRKLWMTGLPRHASLSAAPETWDEFMSRLDARLQAASARNECLYVGIYSESSNCDPISMGFIATPRFVQAVESGGSSL